MKPEWTCFSDSCAHVCLEGESRVEALRMLNDKGKKLFGSFVHGNGIHKETMLYVVPGIREDNEDSRVFQVDTNGTSLFVYELIMGVN